MIFVSNIQESMSDYDIDEDENLDDTAATIYSDVIWTLNDKLTEGGIIVISDMANTLYEEWSGRTKKTGNKMNVYIRPVGHPPVYQKTSDLVLEAFINDMPDKKALYFAKYDVDYKSELAKQALKKASVLLFTGADFDAELIKQDIEPIIDTFLAVDLDTNKAIILSNFETFDESAGAITEKWFAKRFPQMETEREDKFSERFEEFLEDYDL